MTKRKPDHHELAQAAIHKASNLHECIRLIRVLVFSRVGNINKAHERAIVLARENGGAIKFPGLRKFGETSWTEADLSGILV